MFVYDYMWYCHLSQPGGTFISHIHSKGESCVDFDLNSSGMCLSGWFRKTYPILHISEVCTCCMLTWYLYSCVDARVHACMYVCVYTYLYAYFYTSVSVYVCMLVCTCFCKNVHMYACMSICPSVCMYGNKSLMVCLSIIL